MEKIGIFGGTFNPPHVGHLNIVSKFVADYELSKVLIIPTYVPPHKESPNLAPSVDRVEMCKRTFSDPIFEVSTIEIERKGKSYTCDTLKQLKGMFKGAEFYFLCGDDMLLTLHQWYKPKEILDYCTLVASVRTDDIKIEDLKAYSEEYFPDEYEEGKIAFMPIKPLELSSTEIRENIKSKKPIGGLVTCETEEYITSRGLYND